MRRSILLFTFALFALTAHGQVVYRSVMPDGRIIYGDKPARGAKKSTAGKAAGKAAKKKGAR
mgnify:CR=1 FL=1